jgi:protein-tyrosine-phosphatase
VSFAASNAIKELYAEDLLKDYKPEVVNQDLLKKADLVLVMDRGLMKHKSLESILPAGKTYVFKEFFGLKGDIKDPWPNGRDSATLQKYIECAIEIRSILDNGMSLLIKAL